MHIIAAINADLKDAVEKGTFREEIFCHLQCAFLGRPFSAMTNRLCLLYKQSNFGCHSKVTVKYYQISPARR